MEAVVHVVMAVLCLPGDFQVLVMNPHKEERGWIFPGGPVASGEEECAALARHVRDEIGVSVPPEAFVPIKVRRHRHRSLVFSSYAVSCLDTVRDLIGHVGPRGHFIQIVHRSQLREHMDRRRAAMAIPG